MTSSQKTGGEQKKDGYHVLARGFYILLAVFVTILIAVMFMDCADKLCTGEVFKCLLGTPDKKETITFIGLGISGLILLHGAISISKRADAQIETAKSQAKNAKSQAKSARAQVKNNKLIETGNDNERFKAAVDHLGSEIPSARIASFYEFHYLAKSREHLRKSIFNVLCAHLRQTTTSIAYAKNTKPTEEIQSLLDVLFKSTGEFPTDEFIFEGMKANLQRVNLRGADLKRAHLQGANLYDSDLQETNLSKADLRNANLENSKLWRATLIDMKLQSAIMKKAQLWGANLQYSELQDIDADSIQLQGAYVYDCNLSNADLTSADLQGAILESPKFYAAVLESCKIQGTDLVGVQFQGAYIHSLKLQGSRFEETAMGGTTISPAPTPDSRLMSDSINSRVGAKGQIDDVIYFGGIQQGDVDKTADLIDKYRDARSADRFRDRMEVHIDPSDSNRTDPSPEELETAKEGIILDPYTQEDADEWIAEYNEAMKPPN